MPSVIIPAHNEEALIGACIRSVLADGVADLRVVVVPNACTDRTAEIARSFGDAVTVIETETPGKTNAINLAEREAAGRFPRLFLDGDIILRPGALSTLFATLNGSILIASPKPEFETSKSDLFVTLFYRSLRTNKYFASGAPNGSGAFAVSKKGRTRWGEFPEIIADDGYVELHFSDDEARTAEGPGAVVWAPRKFSSLLKIKTRARLGQHELRHRYPELIERRTPVPGRTLRNMLTAPDLWPAIPVYVFVRIYERYAARKVASRRGFTGWLRDETARQPMASGDTQ